MDMELQQQTLAGYRSVFHSMFAQEETFESIVPDSFPDIARIVSASGMAFLKGRECGDGTVKLHGTAAIHVIYIPEGEQTPKSLEVAVPYHCVRDCPQVHNGDFLSAAVCLASSDARAVNPRKVLVRANLSFQVCAYAQERKEVAMDLTLGEQREAEKLQRQFKEFYIAEVLEKPFQFSDVLRQSPSRPDIDEVLRYAIEVTAAEAKLIANKMVIKGELLLSALCRNGESIFAIRHELPFSQIVEAENTAEGAEARISVSLTQGECILREGELEVSVEAVAQAILWLQRTVTVLSDAYCTRQTIDTERTVLTLCTEADHGVVRESGRKFCESGIPARQVLDCSGGISNLTTSREGDSLSVEVQAEVEILYLSEDNSLCAVTYTVPISGKISVPQKAQCQVRCRLCGEKNAVPVTGGLEVRLEADFSWSMSEEEEVACISAVRPGAPWDGSVTRPSVIVRMVGEGESLWEVAKSCNATVADICAANQKDTQSVGSGELLIIPVRR